ncbi:hypothetical protein E4U31_004500 [Claviceps sp. LM219 group G6]|nr:hypothetical protein E4U31_004500 [Claviceps sp. LM219 group G6]
MEAHYPDWSAKLTNFTSSHSAPVKRAPEWRTKKALKCNRLLRLGRTSAILEGINYLRMISKERHPRNGPGPRSCGRGDKPKTVDSFSDIAAGARTIVNVCGASGNALSVSGQVWYLRNWSVIAGGWNCDDDWELPSTGH